MTNPGLTKTKYCLGPREILFLRLKAVLVPEKISCNIPIFFIRFMVKSTEAELKLQITNTLSSSFSLINATNALSAGVDINFN